MWERAYFFDGSDGVVSRHREFEEDPSRKQEVHHDLVVPLLLPFPLHPILPWGHGLSFTVSSSAAHWITSGRPHREKTTGVNMSIINMCEVCAQCVRLCLFLKPWMISLYKSLNQEVRKDMQIVYDRYEWLGWRTVACCWRAVHAPNPFLQLLNAQSVVFNSVHIAIYCIIN